MLCPPMVTGSDLLQAVIRKTDRTRKIKRILNPIFFGGSLTIVYFKTNKFKIKVVFFWNREALLLNWDSEYSTFVPIK